MSSTGQVIGAIVGVAAAIFLPGFGTLVGLQLLGATFGVATLGAAIGGLFDPPSVAKPSFGSVGAAIGSPRYGFDKLQSTASPDLPVPVLYGSLKLAGNIIYQSDQVEISELVTVPDTGHNNDGWLIGLVDSIVTSSDFTSTSQPRSEIQRCIGVCEGEIEEIYDIRINDDDIVNFPNCNYTVYHGTSTQNVDSRFSDSVDGLRYLAYVALTLSTSDKLTGSANITFKALGKLVQTWNGSEWSTDKTYSDNPAACIRDLIISKQYGVGLPAASLDDASFGESYEWCNGLVTDFNGTQSKRATLNYIVDSRRNILDVLNDILATFGGFLVLNGARVKLKVEKDEDISQSFDMSNIVKSSFSYIYLNRNDRPNRVKVQYVDPDYNYTKVLAIADDPNDQDERRSMGVGEDIIEKELALLGITNAGQASRMAEFVLNLGKISNIVITFEVGIRALSAEVGDVVAVSHDITGWVSKPFRIISIQEKNDDTMTLVGREFNSSIYSDNPGQNIIFQNFGDVPSSINKPNPPRNFNVFQNGSVVVFTWDAPIPKFQVTISHYEIHEGPVWSGGQVIADDVAGITLSLSSFTTGEKTYTIQAVSDSGVHSESATDSIDIGIPAGFNAVIAYDDLFDSRFETSGVNSYGIEVIRTIDYDSTQYLRAYTLKTETTWDESTWDTNIWDNPTITDNQTIVIGGNNEIDMLSDTTASIALEINYFIGNTSGLDSYTRTVEISSKSSSGTWSDYDNFVTGFSINQKQFIKFRVTLGTADSEDEVRLIKFNVRVDVPDKIERNSNVSVPVTGLAIQYVTDFYSKVAVTVTTVGASPYIPRTTDKSLDGFTVFLHDTDGNTVSGVVDWVSSGY